MGPQVPTPGYDWLASGGAFYVVAFGWLLSAVFFTLTAGGTGRATRRENDGCLLMICNVLLTLTGGGVGLALGLAFIGYPNFILSSLIGAVLFPAVGNAYLARKMRR